MLTRKMFVLGCAALLGALGAAALPAHAGDDVKKAAAVKAKRDKFRADLKTKGKMPFFDLSYAADPKAVGENRWTQTDPPPFQGVKEEEGGQFFATFSLDITKGTAIEVKAIKLPQSKGNSPYEYTFEHAGMKAKTADKAKMIEGFYKDAMAQLKDPVGVEPKKSNVGPADLFASATGVNATSSKKERQDFYVWTGPNITWLVIATFNEKFLDNEDIVIKAAEFIKTFKELKAPD